MKELDARGLSCPEPVVMIQKALKLGEESYTMLLDAAGAKENVTRYAERQGYKVSIEETEGEYRLTITK